MNKIRESIYIMLICLMGFGVFISVIHWDTCEKDFIVKDFFPRKPYPTFFIDERGLKNPVIYDIHIEHSTLYVKAIGDGAKIAEDIIPLDIRKIK